MLLVKIDIEDDYDDSFGCAVIEVTPTLSLRIKQLSSVVHNLRVLYIKEFDNTPIFFNTPEQFLYYTPKTEEVAIIQRLPTGITPVNNLADCITLCVCKDSFYWSGMIKNTNIHWETCEIPMDILSEEIV